MSRRLVQVVAVAALLVSAGLVLGACGESEEEQASAKVCDARDEIGQQVDRLSTLTLTTATVDDVRSGLQAIGEDLRTIADQQPELSDERRQQVEQAQRTFADQVSSVVADLGSSLSVSGAQRQLEAALTQLQTAYRSSLAQVSCD